MVRVDKGGLSPHVLDAVGLEAPSHPAAFRPAT